MSQSIATLAHGHGAISVLLASSALTLQTEEVKAQVRQIKMLDAVHATLHEHSVSSPVAAILNAIPAFSQVVKFPSAAQFEALPSRKNADNVVAALESLEAGGKEATFTLVSESKDLAPKFRALLSALPQAAQDLKASAAAYRSKIESSDVSEDEVTMLQTTAISSEEMGSRFLALESYLDGIKPFNVDQLRAYPDKIKDEVAGLESFSNDHGAALNVTLSDKGLVHTITAQGDGGTYFMEAKGLTKAEIVFHLDRIDGLADQLLQIGEQGDTLADAVETETQDIPETLDGSETEYGADDHVALLCSYVTLMNASVQESLALASQVFSASDAIVAHIQAGEALFSGTQEI